MQYFIKVGLDDLRDFFQPERFCDSMVLFIPLCIFPYNVAVIHECSIIQFIIFLTFFLPDAALVLFQWFDFV